MISNLYKYTKKALLSAFCYVCAFSVCAETSVSLWDFYTKYLANALDFKLSGMYYSDRYSNKNSYLLPSRQTWILRGIYGDNENITEENLRMMSDSVSFPIFNKNGIEWILNDFKYKDSGWDEWQSYSKEGTLVMNDFFLRDIHEKTYYFRITKNDYIHWEGQTPKFSACTLIINPNDLRNTDEFGQWNWNNDKSYIVLESIGKKTLSRGVTTKFEILHADGKFSLRLTAMDRGHNPAPVFTNPIGRTADNLPIYELTFSFGEDYIPLKFIGETDSASNNVVTYGSYNRFTEDLNTDAEMLLDEFKKHNNCVLTCKDYPYMPSFVFNLEGLETILEYLK